MIAGIGQLGEAGDYFLYYDTSPTGSGVITKFDMNTGAYSNNVTGAAIAKDDAIKNIGVDLATNQSFDKYAEAFQQKVEIAPRQATLGTSGNEIVKMATDGSITTYVPPTVKQVSNPGPNSVYTPKITTNAFPDGVYRYNSGLTNTSRVIDMDGDNILEGLLPEAVVENKGLFLGIAAVAAILMLGGKGR